MTMTFSLPSSIKSTMSEASPPLPCTSSWFQAQNNYNSLSQNLDNHQALWNQGLNRIYHNRK
jgi:hypothetical protein